MLRYDTCLRHKSTLSSVSFQSTTILDIIPVPGLLLVHTPQGLCLLHPGNLQPVTVEGLKEPAPDPADLNPHIQFKGDDMIFQVLKVYNVERQCTEEVVAKPLSDCSEGQEVESAGDTLEEEEGLQVETEPGQCGTLKEGEGTGSDSGAEFTTEAEKMEGETSCKERRDPTDFGSCYVAFTINNRLLVLSISHRYRRYLLLVKLATVVCIKSKVNQLIVVSTKIDLPLFSQGLPLLLLCLLQVLHVTACTLTTTGWHMKL